MPTHVKIHLAESKLCILTQCFHCTGSIPFPLSSCTLFTLLLPRILLSSLWFTNFSSSICVVYPYATVHSLSWSYCWSPFVVWSHYPWSSTKVPCISHIYLPVTAYTLDSCRTYAELELERLLDVFLCPITRLYSPTFLTFTIVPFLVTAILLYSYGNRPLIF